VLQFKCIKPVNNLPLNFSFTYGQINIYPTGGAGVLLYKFIVNPVAGKKEAETLIPQMQRLLKDKEVSYDFYVTRGPEDAIHEARRAVEEGFNVVVAVGGDGTVNEVANGLAGSQAALATIPLGKGNDFAMAMDMPFSPEASLKALLEGNRKTIDLGKVLNRYFVNSLGVGFDASVAYRINRQGAPWFKRGKWPYVYGILATFLSYKPVEMELTLDSETLKCSPMLVAVGIGCTYGGGINILPGSVQDDGYFDVCVIYGMKKLELLYYLPRVIKGNHRSLDKCDFFRNREITIKMARETPIHLDGEIFTGEELHFSLQHRGIHIITASA